MMKRYIKLIAVLIFILILAGTLQAQEKKTADAGKYRVDVYSGSAMGGPYGWGENGYSYDYGGEVTRCGWGLYCKGFANLDSIFGGGDSTYEYWYAGCGIWSNNIERITVPLEYEDDITVRKYYRYTPCEIVVNELRVSSRFPKNGDMLAPDSILGTADQMITVHSRTSMGIDLYLKTLSWSARGHSQYVIHDITFVNTGNVDADDHIELPVSTLDSVMFSRDVFFANGGEPWMSAYGEHTADTLRIPTYSYHCWNTQPEDNWGDPDPTTFNLRQPNFTGEAVLHVDADWHNGTSVSNDPAQPQMTCPSNSDWRVSPWVGSYPIREEGRKRFYRTLYGFTDELTAVGVDHNWSSPYLTTDQYPNTHHTVRMEDWGNPQYHTDLPSSFYNPGWGQHDGAYSCGPWMNVEVGESLHIVLAPATGGMSRKMSYLVGRAWNTGEADTIWGGAPFKLPPQMINHPSLCPTDNDKAKDSYVEAGRDSLFKNVYNAQANFNSGYNIPTPPPSPNLEVTSHPDEITVEWDDRSEVLHTCHGYKLYRARGATQYEITSQGTERGDWELLFQCGGTDPGGIDYSSNIIYEYHDSTAVRGFAYYYSVTAFDNIGGGESLILQNMTFGNLGAARLTRAPGTALSQIRVVPNPWNINAEALQFSGEGEENKIMFYNLPGVCTIKIFNESLDLMTTIHHTDGSGDEPWTDIAGQNFMATSSQQYPASGLYIAHIETPSGESVDKIFYIVR